MPKNYYVVLGIPSTSTQKDIKAAYRRLAKEYHPDYYGGAHSPFLSIQEAYSVLSDPRRRSSYDSTLQTKKLRRPDIPAEPLINRVDDILEPLIPGESSAAWGRMAPPRSFRPFQAPHEVLWGSLIGNFSGSRRR